MLLQSASNFDPIPEDEDSRSVSSEPFSETPPTARSAQDIQNSPIQLTEEEMDNLEALLNSELAKIEDSPVVERGSALAEEEKRDDNNPLPPGLVLPSLSNSEKVLVKHKFINGGASYSGFVHTEKRGKMATKKVTLEFPDREVISSLLAN